MIKQNISNQIQKLNKIDEIEKDFYQVIQDKNIQIKTPSDIERIDVLFNDSLKKMLKVIEGYDEEEYTILKSRFIIDFHVRLAEKYNFDQYSIASYFGSYNERIFQEAIKNIKKYL